MDMVIRLPIRTALRAALFLSFVVSAGAASAQGVTDSIAVATTVDRYINALKTRDTAYIRAASLSHATSLSIAVPSLPGQRPTIRSVDETIAALARETRRFDGRVWSPRVSIEGDIAVFIAPYDVWYDGQFSACGVDHYILVRSGDRWLVSQLLYTRQREGCAPAPMGPPD